MREPEKLASLVLGSCRMTVLDLRRRANAAMKAYCGKYARTITHVEPLEPLDTVTAQLLAAASRARATAWS